VRLPAFLLALVVLAGCGGTGSTGSFGETTLALGPAPTADEAGVFLATARDYDGGEGVELEVTREDAQAADFRLVERPPPGCVAVLAIVRPAKLVLCADEITLQDERPKVVAVARALRRGYTQTQIEPDAAVEAMLAEEPGLDRNALSTELDAAVPTWTAGAPYFGQLAPGPGRDSSIAADARDH
jgi:hypothetical protein